MVVRSILGSYIDNAKRDFEKLIEINVEETLEEERDESYAKSLLELCDKIAVMANSQKDVMRVDTIKKLEDQRDKINALWKEFVDRTIMFSVWFDVYIRFGILFSITALLLKLYVVALVFLVASIALIISGHIEIVYNKLSYFFTGSRRFVEELQDAYARYGKLEAKLYLSDFRGMTHVEKDQKSWVFTTSHKKAPSS